MFGASQSVRAKRAATHNQTAHTASIPAPLGGWNARDSIANMPPDDAVTMINWFPTPADVAVRKGYSNWSTGYGAAVETLMLYEGNTQERLFAASGTSFYDATSSGAVGAAVQTGLTNAKWIHVNFTTTGGVRYLMAVNGFDKPRLWDGAAWIAVDGASTPAITGITTTSINYVTSHKSRLWVTIKNTMEVWYSPVGGFGAFNLMDLRSIFKRGGTITAIETWSLDGGYGLDDHLVFMSSNGEIAIYRGTDPSSASTWALIGLYYFSAPVGMKPLYKFGGDVLVLCFDGMLPLSQSLQSSRVNTQTVITDKIQYALANQISATFGTYGWQMTSTPTENALLINVPQATSGVFEQYVMNTITGAWCRFQNWNARCWETWKDQQYFGNTTAVCKAFDGTTDGGVSISTYLKPAFNYFGSRGQLKQWTMARAILSTDGAPGTLFGLNVDFDDTTPSGVLSYTPLSAGVWDTAKWDVGLWGGGLSIQKNWQNVSGLGYCASLVVQTITSGAQLRLMSFDFVYKIGGIL
jgi:hypothetical protein